jgi:hypothetical protein
MHNVKQRGHTDIREIGHEGAAWIETAHDKIQ